MCKINKRTCLKMFYIPLKYRRGILNHILTEMFRPDLGGDCSESPHWIPLLPRPAPARDVRVVEVVGLCHQTTLCPRS